MIQKADAANAPAQDFYDFSLEDALRVPLLLLDAFERDSVVIAVFDNELVDDDLVVDRVRALDAPVALRLLRRRIRQIHLDHIFCGTEI